MGLLRPNGFMVARNGVIALSSHIPENCLLLDLHLVVRSPNSDGPDASTVVASS
jgi:hypothetical protein